VNRNQQLIDDCTALGKRLQSSPRWTMPTMELHHCRLDTTQVTELAALESLLREFAPSEGWLTSTSANQYFNNGDLELKSADIGLPLEGEMINPQGEALDLRQSSSRGWIVTRFASDSDAPLWPSDTIDQLAIGGGLLTYRRYWQLDQAGAITQRFCHFTGFADRSPQ
jgi:hypothetical protein